MAPKSFKPISRGATLLLLTIIVLIVLAALTNFTDLPRPSLTLAVRSPLKDTIPSAGQQHIKARGRVAPRFCSVLAANPLTQNRHPDCTNRYRHVDKYNLKCARFFSQYHQDVWVWKALAQFMPGPGVYVDIGANEPAAISNSYFLDKCLGWKGFCFEGQAKLHPALRRHRTCEVHACASDREETVPFIQAGNLGGIDAFNKNKDGRPSWRERIRKARTVMTKCVPLRKVLDKAEVQEVHYLSVDVEGAEVKVLQGIDFDRTHIAIVSVEGSNPEATDILLRRGYSMYTIGGDRIFMSPKTKAMVEELKGEGYLETIKVPTA